MQFAQFFYKMLGNFLTGNGVFLQNQCTLVEHNRQSTTTILTINCCIYFIFFRIGPIWNILFVLYHFILQWGGTIKCGQTLVRLSYWCPAGTLCLLFNVWLYDLSLPFWYKNTSLLMQPNLRYAALQSELLNIDTAN